MASACEAAVTELRAGYPQRKFEFAVAGDTRGIWDKARIGQTLSNLLENAVHYGDDASPITVRVEGDKAWVKTQITNRGAVIAPAEVSTLFKPFMRGENAAMRGRRDGGMAWVWGYSLRWKSWSQAAARLTWRRGSEPVRRSRSASRAIR